MSKAKQQQQQPKDMTARDRLLLLRVNDRRGGDEAKRLQGKVSEAKTDFKNTLKAAVPDDGEEAKARLRKLQLLDEEVVSRKTAKATFKQRVKETHHVLLHSEISEGGQLVLPGQELELDVDQLQHLRTGISEVRTADDSVRAGGEEAIAEAKYPLEDKGLMSAADALLLQFIDSAKLTSAALGAVPTAGEAAAESAAKGGKRGKDAAAAAPVH